MHAMRLACAQMNSLEAFQLDARRDRSLRRLDVQLDHFVAVAWAGIAHFGGDCDGVAGLDCLAAARGAP